MYILWIGWLYVVLMLVVVIGTDNLPMAGFLLLVLGVFPSWLLFFAAHRRQQLKAEGVIEPRPKRKSPSAEAD